LVTIEGSGRPDLVPTAEGFEDVGLRATWGERFTLLDQYIDQL